MRCGEPLPKTWRYVSIVVAVVLLAGVGELGKSLAEGGIIVAVGIGLAVGLIARVLYQRSRQ